ncbi:MAG: SdiA-regulated domain-containing protein [Ferruginibacter sp.]
MLKIIFSSFLVFFACSACTQRAKDTSVAGYDLGKPAVMKMPAGLNEISGIAFNNGNPDTMYAIQDEEGKLFYFATSNIGLQHIKFGKKGDYEDLAICKGMVVVLRSDGTLFTFQLNLAGEKMDSVQEFKDLLPKDEYEGIYADEQSGEILVLCKNCSADNAKQVTVNVLQLNGNGTLSFKNNFVIDTRQIAAQQHEKKIAFRPSALTKNKITNEWFLLSSVHKLLVIMDAQWKLKEALPLDPALFPQPEGIAFDRDNNLYISNERVSIESATVLKFIKTGKP